MNLYNISFTATCKQCNSTNSFMRVLVDHDNEDEIENPTFNELLNYVDRGEITVCPMCETTGQFNITKFEFDDNEITNEIANTATPYSTYIIKSDKNNGEIRAWIEAGYFSIAEVSVAFDAIKKFFDNELWNEPLEGKDNGAFEINVEFYKDPFQTKVILKNNDYSQDEITMIVKAMYDNIPNDRK